MGAVNSPGQEPPSRSYHGPSFVSVALMKTHLRGDMGTISLLNCMVESITAVLSQDGNFKPVEAWPQLGCNNRPQ